MVLPERFELSASPFITLTLSCPPMVSRCLCAGPSLQHRSLVNDPRPLDATRLASTPSHAAELFSAELGLARDYRRHRHLRRFGFPEFEWFFPDRFRSGWQKFTKGVLYP